MAPSPERSGKSTSRPHEPESARVVPFPPPDKAALAQRKGAEERKKIILLDRLKKVDEPKALNERKLKKLSSQAQQETRRVHQKQQQDRAAYIAERNRRRTVEEELSRGGLFWSEAMVASKMRRGARREQKETVQEKKNRNTIFTTSFWRNLPYAAMAIFTSLNAAHEVDRRAEAASQPPPRVRTLEETERLDRAWEIQQESTIVFGAPDSPFADLFDEDHDKIELPNLFFGRDGINLFGTLMVRREDEAQVSGPELLRRVWGVKCEASSSLELATLRDERLATYDAAVEAGTLQRSSLALEAARVSGFESGTAYTNAIWGHIRWDELQQERGLSDENLLLLRDITGFLTPAHIEAIILAELAPQMELPYNERSEEMQERQAEINVRLYDFVLRRYGREFVNDFPALGDRLVSIGGVQSTFYVLGEGSSTDIINDHLDPEAYALLALSDGHGGIKTSIAESPSQVLSLEEQRAVGYLNAIYNVMHAIETSPGVRQAFERIREGIVGGTPSMRMQAQERLAEFLFSHNDPQEAIEATSAWNARGRSLSLADQLAMPIARFADERNHREYATSMRFNYIALDEIFSPVLADREIRGNAIAERGGVNPTVSFPEDDVRWNEIRRRIRNSIS